MNRLIAAVPMISRASVRGLKTSQVRPIKPDLTELKKKQLEFQVDSGRPIYLKGKSDLMAGRLLCNNGTKKIRTMALNVLRLSSTEEPCPPKPDPCPVQPASNNLSPPPCPPKPSCPPTLCPKIPDPNNPCNYCSPPCIDPDYPDLTKLKKLQCKFQEDNGIPTYLKRGSVDVYAYHAITIMTFTIVLVSLYFAYKKM